jgi:hypothetical protein
MGVFTTQTLLSSVGVSRNRVAPGAVAINWILKVRMPLICFMVYVLQIELYFQVFPVY